MSVLVAVIRRAARLILVASLLLACACSEDDDVPRSLERASEAYNAGLYLEAETNYEEFLQSSPGNPHRWEAWNRLVDISLSIKNDPDKAIILLDAMHLEYGRDPQKAAPLLLKMGDVNAGLKRWDKAVEAWQRGLQLPDLDKRDSWAFSIRLARAFRLLGQYDLAQEAAQDCLQYATDKASRTDCKYEHALIYSFMENWSQAKKLLEEVLTSGHMTQEDASVLKFLLADIYIYEGESEKARSLLESIRDTYPNPKAVETKLRFLER